MIIAKDKQDRIGIDDFIYKIQKVLDDKIEDDVDIYGLAKINAYKTQNGSRKIPQVFIPCKGFSDIFYSENNKIFFLTDNTFVADGNTNFRTNLYIYCCFELDGDNDNEIRTKITKYLGRAGIKRPDLDIGFEKVFSDFTIDNANGMDYYPYHWFRFKANETFKIEQQWH